MSAAKLPNCAWWKAMPYLALSIEDMRDAAEALEAGRALAKDPAALIAKAFRAYLAGDTDITRNLGLRPRRGGRHETPINRQQQHARNSDIRRLCAGLPGSDSEKARLAANLLSTPAEEGRVTDAEVAEYVLGLQQQYVGQLPSSGRQILRILRKA